MSVQTSNVLGTALAVRSTSRTRRFPRLTLSALLLGLLLMVAGCGGDGGSSATAQSPATLGFTDGGAAAPASAPASASAPLNVLPNGVNVDVFRFGAREIELQPDMDKETRSGAEFEGQFLVDLIAGTVDNAKTGTTAAELLGFLPMGTYEELEFKMTPIAGVDPALPSTPVALAVSGSYTSGAGARNYTVRVSVPLKIEIEGPQAIVIDGSSNDLLVAIRLDTLLTPANLDALIATPGLAVESPAGTFTITVDGSTPPTTLEAVRQLIKSALEFGEDENGDHDLNDDEDVADHHSGH